MIIININIHLYENYSIFIYSYWYLNCTTGIYDINYISYDKYLFKTKLYSRLFLFIVVTQSSRYLKTIKQITYYLLQYTI